MSRRDAHDVIVIGAGVVGATAALALAQRGLKVALVEAQAPKPWLSTQPDLRVYALAMDGQKLLASLGIWTSIASARAHPFRSMQVWDAAGGAPLRFAADSLGQACLGYIVEHGLLVDRLWHALEASGVELLCPDAPQQLINDEAVASIILDSGRQLRARLVLGADGAASQVRELVGGETRERDYAQRAVVAYVDTEQAHQDTCWQRFLPGGPLAFLPCADGRSSIVWTLPSKEAQRVLAQTDAAFCAGLTRAFDARLGQVTGASVRAGFPLRRRLVEKMVHGRVALLGDAAHVVHPLAGQGVNLGLRDVASLMELMADAPDSTGQFISTHRLHRWERTRLSDNAAAAYSFEAINGFFSNDDLLPTLLRGPLLGLAGRIPPLANWFWKRAEGR